MHHLHVEYQARRTIWYARHLPRGGVGVEVGVHRGVNLVSLVVATRPSKLWAIDPWETPYGRRPLSRMPDLDRVRTLVEALELPVEVVVGKDADTGPVDWVYIDGNHHYPHPLTDLKLWAPRARVVAGHDWNWPGVQRSCREYFGRDPDVISDTTDWLYLENR